MSLYACSCCHFTAKCKVVSHDVNLYFILSGNDRMKSLLMQTFPRLIFHQPPRRNISLLVFTDTFTAKTVASQCASGSSDGSESETSAAEVSDCDIGTDAGPSSAGPSSSRPTRQSNAVPRSGREIDADIVRIIYNAGMFLKAEGHG